MRYAYYPGCSLHSTGSEFDISLKAVCPKMGVELDEEVAAKHPYRA